MVNILYVPPKLALPVSKGGDLVVDFQQQIDDIYTDYGLGVVVRMEVDIASAPVYGGTASPPTTITATAVITNHHAVCRFDFIDADAITDGSLWRCVVVYPTIPQTTEVVGMNGRIKREDGN